MVDSTEGIHGFLNDTCALWDNSVRLDIRSTNLTRFDWTDFRRFPLCCAYQTQCLARWRRSRKRLIRRSPPRVDESISDCTVSLIVDDTNTRMIRHFSRSIGCGIHSTCHESSLGRPLLWDLVAQCHPIFCVRASCFNNDEALPGSWGVRNIAKSGMFEVRRLLFRERIYRSRMFMTCSEITTKLPLFIDAIKEYVVIIIGIAN